MDPQERRELIVNAVLRLAARHGLEAVTLRHVADEAGVTAGMVQHYFSSKDEMMRFAMHAASERYELRMGARIAALGDSANSQSLVLAMLSTLIPVDDAERDDARVALAFESFAATDAEAAAELRAGNSQLRDYLAHLLEPVGVDAFAIATALLGAAEGLAMHVLSSGLSPADATAALEALVRLAFAQSPHNQSPTQ